AHEIRNPLTSIKMIVQAGNLGDDDLRVVEREIRRMEQSLQSFLNLTRPPKLERLPQQLPALVEHTFNLIRARADKQRVALRLRAAAGLPRVEADGSQLQQVLLNLALNALDAMPRGGSLDVEVAAAGDWAAVAVRDTGPGVPAEVEPRLFQPFVTTK